MTLAAPLGSNLTDKPRAQAGTDQRIEMSESRRSPISDAAADIYVVIVSAPVGPPANRLGSAGRYGRLLSLFIIIFKQTCRRLHL